jgi:hypothetical protein
MLRISYAFQTRAELAFGNVSISEGKNRGESQGGGGSFLDYLPLVMRASILRARLILI